MTLIRCRAWLLAAAAVPVLSGCPVAVDDRYALEPEGTGGPPSHCRDGQQNEGETDTDCGGSECAACRAGTHCELPSDCFSSLCAVGVCQPQDCSDEIKNGTETDSDCGGPDCLPCTTGQACLLDRDCLSQRCTDTHCAEE